MLVVLASAIVMGFCLFALSLLTGKYLPEAVVGGIAEFGVFPAPLLPSRLFGRGEQ